MIDSSSANKRESKTPTGKHVAMSEHHLEVQFVDLSQDETADMCDIIRRNLSVFEEVGSVLAATYRRLDGLFENYQGPGLRFLVAKNSANNQLVGGAGIGPLAGLPLSEGYGEIRDLVIEPDYRGKGLGANLLKACIGIAKEFGYKRLYLKTTPQMQNAQRLFERFGFRAVIHGAGEKLEPKTGLPCYYLLEDLAAVTH